MEDDPITRDLLDVLTRLEHYVLGQRSDYPGMLQDRLITESTGHHLASVRVDFGCRVHSDPDLSEWLPEYDPPYSRFCDFKLFISSCQPQDIG